MVVTTWALIAAPQGQATTVTGAVAEAKPKTRADARIDYGDLTALLFGQGNAEQPIPARRDDAELNLLLLEVTLGHESLADVLNAYEIGDDILLPVGELARILTIGVTVDQTTQTASGFVMREDQVGGVHIHVLSEPGAIPYFHPTHNEFFMTRAEFDASHPIVHVLAPGPFLVRFQAVLATLPPLGAGAQFLGVPMPAPALIPVPAPIAVAPILPAPLGAALPIPAPVALGAALAPPVPLPIPAAGGGGIALPSALIAQLLQTLLNTQGGHKSAATDNYDASLFSPVCSP